MAEDDAQKTEDPTGKRLSQQREEGHVPTSRELQHWMMLSASTLACVGLGPTAMQKIAAALTTFLDSADKIALDSDGLPTLMRRVLTDLALAMLFPLILMLVAAVAVGVAQNGLVFSTKKLAPDLSSLNPLRGAQKLFSPKRVVDVIKDIAKIALVVGAIYYAIWPQLTVLPKIYDMEIPTSLVLMRSLEVKLLIAVLSALALIAILDFAWQRFTYNRDLRMSKQEVKDEHKSSEGDPQIKAKLRNLRAQRARQRMMAAVPKADVVVTNPTHFAVALKYDPQTMEAPRLVAKGADLIALRIRQIAEENDVPVMENPPLARALYASVELDQEVPPDHYRAVAEVISYVFKLKRKAM